MTSIVTQHNKETVWDFWQKLPGASADGMTALVADYVCADVGWHGPHPINDLLGVEALVAGFWRPLLRSFPDLRRETDVFLGGPFEGREWVAGTGHFVGTFAEDWLGIPASGQPTAIRFGEFCRLEEGRIAEVYIILDIIGVMLQTGRRVLPPSPGDESKAPGPSAGNGVLLTPQDDAVGAESRRLVEAMIAGLGRFDRQNLASMDMPDYWSRDMQWYGPIGIGTAHGLADYEQVHAGPFLRAFPDRKGGHHKARLAEGDYVASTGWPSVYATHSGDYLGQPVTGQRIGMRVMDFWRREGDLLVQNWVFIDLIDLFRQFGVDLFERLGERVA